MTEALDQLQPDEIYVATGAHNSALWGELLTATAKSRGATGAVLDGYSRDTPQVLEQNFPVFCSGVWAQDSSVRTYVFDFRCDIEIGQVTVHNGDVVFGDVDGVLIIPRSVAEEVIEKALEKASKEKTATKSTTNNKKKGRKSKRMYRSHLAAAQIDMVSQMAEEAFEIFSK